MWEACVTKDDLERKQLPTELREIREDKSHTDHTSDIWATQGQPHTYTHYLTFLVLSFLLFFPRLFFFLFSGYGFGYLVWLLV